MCFVILFVIFKLWILIKIKWLFVLLEISVSFFFWRFLVKWFVLLMIFCVYVLKLFWSVLLNVIVFVVIMCISGLFWILGKIDLLICFVNCFLYKIILLCGLCNVLCVVVVMKCVCGIGFGCKLVVIKFVICVILIIK